MDDTAKAGQLLEFADGSCRRADGDCGRVLPDQQFREPSCAWALIPFSLHSATRRPWGTIADLWLLVIGVNVPKWEEKASAWRVSGA